MIPRIPEWARWLAFGLIAAVLVYAIFAMGRCSDRSAVQDQAKQTTASSEAIADAAEGAIETIGVRVVTEKEIDRATAVATMEIEDAATPDDVRDAVIRAVCVRREYINDPACAMREPDPR